MRDSFLPFFFFFLLSSSDTDRYLFLLKKKKKEREIPFTHFGNFEAVFFFCCYVIPICDEERVDDFFARESKNFRSEFILHRNHDQTMG